MRLFAYAGVRLFVFVPVLVDREDDAVYPFLTQRFEREQVVLCDLGLVVGRHLGLGVKFLQDFDALVHVVCRAELLFAESLRPVS